ncbi:MAG: hypothetical protein ACREUG_13920 [Steroidobacteraceae bacterium]
MASNPDPDSERRRRIKRTAIVLGLIALAFYVAYIAVSLYNSEQAARTRSGGRPPASAPAPAPR